MKKAEYKVAIGKQDIKSLETKVSEMLNDGWKPIGGIALEAGIAYQAMARVISINDETKLTANQAMRELDKIT